MSTLKETEKQYLERILDMPSGYVLNYTDATFAQFFKRFNIDIHSQRYQTYGTSKAKKLRAFWEQESDAVVGRVLSEMLDSYETLCDLHGKSVETNIFQKAQIAVYRLLGREKPTAQKTSDQFLNAEFAVRNLDKLPIESQVVKIIEMRLDEARKALNAGAHLSVIFLCGSALEGVLLGLAQRNPKSFNESSLSPKNSEGKVKQFHEWTLAQLIDCSVEIGYLGLDVKKFSHGLRDFRNYIHPYEQMVSKFNPDEHTAKVCFQVLKAALAGITGGRA